MDHFRGLGFLVCGVGIQLVLGLDSVGGLLLIAAMGSMVVFLFLNREWSGFTLALIGLVLNMVVIAANGAMPVSHDAIEKMAIAGVHPTDLRHMLADGSTTLAFLGDVIPFGDKIVSIGDVLLVLGLSWFLFGRIRNLFSARGNGLVPVTLTGEHIDDQDWH